jgi:hypothetical protein
LVRNCSLAVGLILLLLATGCDSHRSSARSPFVVSAAGRIGTLYVDQSDRAAVIAFAGRPDAERHGRESLGSAPYDALGYGCQSKGRLWNFPLLSYPHHAPSCRTVFWVDVPTGKLVNFFTSDHRYVEAHGVRIGMATAVAERLLRQRVSTGCEQNVYLPSGDRHVLTIAFDGPYDRKTLHVIGGQVFAFVLHSRGRDAGVFDCL